MHVNNIEATCCHCKRRLPLHPSGNGAFFVPCHSLSLNPSTVIPRHTHLHVNSRWGEGNQRALNSKSKRTSFPQKLVERHWRKRLKLGLGTDQIVNTDTTGFLSIRRPPATHHRPSLLQHPSVRNLPTTRHFCSPTKTRRTSSFTRSGGKETHTRNKKDHWRKERQKHKHTLFDCATQVRGEIRKARRDFIPSNHQHAQLCRQTPAHSLDLYLYISVDSYCSAVPVRLRNTLHTVSVPPFPTLRRKGG